MAKVSKNAKVGKRLANAGSGRDYVQITISVKDPVTGKYTYKTQMVHKDKKKEFFDSLK